MYLAFSQSMSGASLSQRLERGLRKPLLAPSPSKISIVSEGAFLEKPEPSTTWMPRASTASGLIAVRL